MKRYVVWGVIAAAAALVALGANDPEKFTALVTALGGKL